MDARVKAMKERLQEEMTRRDLTAMDLSVIAGVHTDTVKNYLSPCMPAGKVEIWLLLSDALGHDDLSWLLTTHE